MAPHIFQPKEPVERHLARLQYIDAARCETPPRLLIPVIWAGNSHRYTFWHTIKKLLTGV